MLFRLKATLANPSLLTSGLGLLFVLMSSGASFATDNVAKRIVFIAGKPSHDYGSHEHFAGSRILADVIQKTDPNVKCEVIRNGWPADESVLDNADAIVIYSDGGGGHYLHAVVAVDADDNAILGLIDGQFLSRSEGRKAVRRVVPIEQKESYRWLQGAESAGRCGHRSA